MRPPIRENADGSAAGEVKFVHVGADYQGAESTLSVINTAMLRQSRAPTKSPMNPPFQLLPPFTADTRAAMRVEIAHPAMKWNA